MFTHILCPVDFSEDSERALETALVLARATSAHLTLITVVDPLLNAGAEAAGADDTLDRQTQAELRALLERTSRGQALPSIYAVAVTVGRPGDEIIAQARESRADVIVMGMRGLGGAARWILGSTTEFVLRRIDIPVLVVPPRNRA